MAGLRLPRHRATTAHLASAYPFVAEGACGASGVYLGRNILTGGGAFAYDPFVAYRAGLVTNPNMLLAGEPGVGKSATAKCFLYRAAGVFGRWVAIVDPKGEYEGLAATLGLKVLRLFPGGATRINPLDGATSRPDDREGRRASPVRHGRRAARLRTPTRTHWEAPGQPELAARHRRDVECSRHPLGDVDIDS